MRPLKPLLQLSSLAILIALGAGGCANQPRALHMIEASGDRAADQADYALAAAEYRLILDRRPGRWDVRQKLAEALLELDSPAEAREHAEVAYTLRPADADLIDLLAEAMLESGDVAGMSRELRFAAEESGAATDWYRLGVFLSRAGDDDAAELALLTAARIDRGLTPLYQQGLARFYAGLGDEERALERYRMAYALAPQSESINQSIRAMGYIPGPTFGTTPLEQNSEDPSAR